MDSAQPHGNGAHGRGNPQTIKVLMYHRIVTDEHLCRTHWTCVHELDFRRQLQLLDRWGFTAITFEDYKLYLDGELDLPRKPVIITFDDGYLDTYTTAFPILQEFGMKAVIFALGEQKIQSNTWDNKLGLPKAPLVRGQQLVELHAAGMEIGSHSINHANLAVLSEGEAWEEISRSRILLEILLNAPVRCFSYPYGLVNGKLKSMAQHAGYQFACSVDTGPSTFGEDPFEIRRIAIPNTTGVIDYSLRLLTPYPYYRWTLSRAKQALLRTNGKWNGGGRSSAEKSEQYQDFSRQE